MRLLLTITVLTLQLVQSFGKEKGGSVVHGDLPFIACDVCERTVEEIMSAVDKARLSVPKNKLDELHITEIIEGVINPAIEAGEWMRRIDIIDATIKDKTYLSLVETGGTSKCKNECATIAKSCQTLMHEEVDMDELSALIWKNKSTLKDLKAKVCTQWTKRCKPPRKAVPASYKRVDEEFEPMSEKDLEMDRMMANMRAMGMGGSLYSRDDLGDMMGFDGMDEEEEMDLGGDGGAFGGDAGGNFEL